MNLNVIDDDLLVDTRLRHGDDFVGSDGPGRDGPPKSRLDLGTIAGFDLIHAAADGGPGQRSGSGTDGRSREWMTRRAPDRRADSGAHQATK